MERVRAWATENAYKIVDELAYIDTRTDRATDGCKSALAKIRKANPQEKLALFYVDFCYVRFWRRNRHIYDHAVALGFDPIGISPDPITIDGKQFDPIKHFEQSRESDRNAKKTIKEKAESELMHSYLKYSGSPSRFRCIADELNAGGIPTFTGKGEWTADNVRKAVMNKLPSIDD
jgi:hypothetical protein